jgi:putative acetyltransferase
MQITIRQEQAQDHARVYQINARAFGGEAEALLVNRLRMSLAFVPELSLVAENETVLIGYLLLTKIQIWHNKIQVAESLALAPLAVLPEFQKKGIGSALVGHGLVQARAMNFKSVVVLGHPHYYPKFGFMPAHSWGIKAPFAVKPNHFMALELKPNALAKASGLVEYPREFEVNSFL